MKSIFNKPLAVMIVICGLLMSIVISSCKKNHDGAAPTITRVRTVSKQVTTSTVTPATIGTTTVVTTTNPAAFDSTVTAGSLNGMYAIVGQNLLTTSSVTFNGVPATLNRALNTDNAVIVTIAPNTPYQSQSGKLTVTTDFGTTSFNFNILQPPPAITAVSQFAGNAGDVITVNGTAFDNVSSVAFGTVAGQITANTATQISVKVPANALGPISVTTPGGTTAGPAVSYDGIAQAYIIPFGFKGILYDDAINSGYDFSFNGVVSNTQSTAVVKRGTYSIMVQYNGNYAGYAVGNGAGIDLTNKTYVKFSIYGGSTGIEGRVMKIALNDFDNRAVSVIIHEKVWSTYVIPISLFQNAKAPGTPTSLSYLGFQDISGLAPETVYLDDIGVF